MHALLTITVRAILATCLATAMMCSVHAALTSHVVHVSFDGLRGDLLATYIENFPAEFTNFKRFVDEGATTFNARTDYTSTVTLPNHTSMLTGRPVERPAGTPATVHHGYTSDGLAGSTATLHSGNPSVSYIASIFDVVHDHGLSTSLYAAKTKFNLYPQSYGENAGAPDLTDQDNGRDKIDLHLVTEDFPAMHAALLDDLALHEFNYSFVHYSLMDGVGHNGGWESEDWRIAAQFIDGYLGDIVQRIETDAGLAGDTIVIVTSDHGGTGTSHGNPSVPANYTIPVLVWGPGVAPGADLYGLNRHSRSDPGTDQPSYTAAGQPIRNGDTGNLALRLLGLGPVPGSTINALQDLAVATPFVADFNADLVVDSLDLYVWQAAYGTPSHATRADGDANGNGSVDGEDFLIWQREAGSCSIGPFMPIPEPNAGTLLWVSLLTATVIARRR